MTAVAPARADRRPTAFLARIVTELTTPALVNTAVPLAIGGHAGSLAWGATVSLSAGVVPFIGILAGIRTRKVTDHHVTVRRERPAVMLFILSCLLAALTAQMLFAAPRPVWALTSAMLATLVMLAVVTIALRWKVSVHAAVAAGSAIMLAEALGAWWMLALGAVPGVMWSRVEVEDHNVRQVWVGGVVGLLVAGTVFGLLHH